MVWPNADSGSAVNKVPSINTQIGAMAARGLRRATVMTTMTTSSS